MSAGTASRAARTASRRRAIRLVSLLGAFSVLGLLTYPLPSAWLGLGGLGVLLVGRWRLTGSPLPASPFSVPLGLYLAGAAIGLCVTAEPNHAAVSLFGQLAAVGAFFLVLGIVSSPATARRLVSVAILAVAVAAPVLLVLLPTGERLLQYPYPDLLADHVAVRAAVWSMDAHGQRFRMAASGVGALAIYGLGLALGPLLAGESRRARLLGGLALAYFGSLLVINNNRTSILSAVLVILLFGAVLRPWLAAGALLVLGMAGAVIAGLIRPESMPLVGHLVGLVSGLRRSSFVDLSSLGDRVDIWGDVLFLLGDFPITGLGLGQVSPARIHGTYFPADKFGFAHAHNIFLQSYLEQGLLGLLGLLGLVAVGLVLAIRLVLHTRCSAVRSASISAGGVVLGLTLVGLTDIDAVTTVGLVLLAWPLALLGSMARSESERARERESERAVSEGARGRGGGGAIRQYSLALSLPRSLALALAVALLAAFGAAAVALPPATTADPPPSSAAHQVAARLYLNIGALEVARARLGTRQGERAPRQQAERALSLIKRAIDHAPDDPRPQRALAALLAVTDPAEALPALARAEALTAPGDSRALLQLGWLYRQVGAVEAALAVWTRVDPSVGVWRGNGIDYRLVSWGADLVRDQRWPEAVAVNLVAIDITPTNPAPWNAVGVALVRAVGPGAGLEKLEALVRSYPDVPWAYEEVRNLHRRAGNWREATVWEERATSAGTSAAWSERQLRAAAQQAYHHRFSSGTRFGPLAGRTPPGEISDGLSRDLSAFLITNDSDEIRSYTVEVEFRRDDRPFAAARGTASNLRPRERRAVIPSPPLSNQQAGSFTVLTRFVYSAGQAGRHTEAAEKLRLEEPTALSDLGLDVTVTNGDPAARSAVVQAVLGHDGRFVHLLTGTATDLRPGESKVVTLIAKRPLPSYNQVLLAVERVLE